MRRAVLVLVAALAGSGCEAPREGCGVLGCISSPHLRARGGPAMIGAPVIQAVAAMGAAPTGTLDVDARTKVLSWTRQQQDRDVGFLSCTEMVGVRDGVVIDYMRRGNCGG